MPTSRRRRIRFFMYMLPVVPIPDSWRSFLRSFYDLIGAGEQRRREGYAERRCRLSVQYHLELGWGLNGKVRRFRPSKYLIHIGGTAVVKIGLVHPVGHQPTTSGKKAIRVNGRQSFAGGERYNRVSGRIGKHAR